MRKLVIAVIACTALVTASVVYAQQATKTQTLTVKVKPAKAGSKKKPRGITLDVTTLLNTSDGSKASPATRTVVFFAKGIKFNNTKFPTCDQTALEQNGPSGCPKGSQVGKGSAIVDARPVIAQPIQGQTLGFNAKGKSILLYTVTTVPISTSTTLVGKLKKASGKYGFKLDVTIPPLPTLPGQPNATIQKFQLTTKATIKKGKKKYNYVEGPTTCKKSWPFSGTFSYEDGTSLTATSTVKCKK
jgi:hypothetical protein